MPQSLATARDPFRGPGRPTTDGGRLRVPQARILAALCPAYPDDPPTEWPLLNRASLSRRAGYTAISGSTTRALNGIHPNSSSGDAHPGLLALRFVEEVQVDVLGDGSVRETCYRVTAAGIAAHQAHVAEYGDALPALRDAAASTNHRYRE